MGHGEEKNEKQTWVEGANESREKEAGNQVKGKRRNGKKSWEWSSRKGWKVRRRNKRKGPRKEKQGRLLQVVSYRRRVVWGQIKRMDQGEEEDVEKRIDCEL